MNTYSLIANSGIQFYNCRIDIDLKSQPKQIFHEWFDQEEVQTNLEFAYFLKESEKFVRMADMEKYGFLDEDGKLIVSEKEVLAVPNLEVLHEGEVEEETEELFWMQLGNKFSKLDLLLDQWLPLPYFELDTVGNYKNGPYNWVRCKLIPRPTEKQDILSVDVLLAFDTRSIYDESDEYAECPSFRETEKDKYFKLTGNAISLLDFCSGRNSWIRSYLMKLVHGVTDLDDIKLDPNKDGNKYKYSFLATYLLLVHYISKGDFLPSVRLIRDRGVKHIDEEMIIDIGNSRTAAVLFEDGDFTKVKPLRLQNFTFPITADGQLNRTQESFDMRVAFQKVSFGENTMIGSNQFIWPSLVRLGSEAEYLTHETVGIAEGDEILSTYSSPKRYLWDNKPRQEEWRCVRVTPDGRNEEPLLEGISNYFDDDGKIDKDGFGSGLHYSRKTLMTLAFMEIISQAQVQINSFEYREFHGRLSTPRRIDKVILTCPTAMSKNEQLSLHDSLKDALFVLNKFNDNLGDIDNRFEVKVVPELQKRSDNPQWIFDEATCSQFVYLYGEFSETYLNNSKEFFGLYGKKRPSENGTPVDSLVIGSFDIGAGTSDIMVCQYEYDKENPYCLKPIPKFWDSFDFAGDDMLKVLIENVLLQGKHAIFEHELAKRGKDEAEITKLLYQFFGSDNNSLSFRDRTLRRDFNLQVCVPVLNCFLDLLSKDTQYREIPFEDIFAKNMPSEAVMQKFKEHFGFGLDEFKWVYDGNVMNNIIENTMNDLLESVATIMYSQGCDLVILSGRPSSLPPIKEIFLKYFAVDPNRLIVLNKHRIGRWYPFADESGYLTNSKSVVPVGAMIGYLASNAGGLNGFSLDLSSLGELLKPTTDYFLVKDEHMHQNKCFITPNQNNGTIVVNSLPVYIGCKQFDLALYPVRPFYVLELDLNSIMDKLVDKNKNANPLTESIKQDLLKDYCDRILARNPLKVELERDDYEENKELLRISAVEGSDNANIPVSDFSLTVQSLNDPDCYWLDSGAFNINITSNR